MSLCERCSIGGYHGFRRDEWPSTIYFWCPAKESHAQVTMCERFERGKPKMFDKNGEEMK